jgi:hypothetical protein
MKRTRHASPADIMDIAEVCRMAAKPQRCNLILRQAELIRPALAACRWVLRGGAEFTKPAWPHVILQCTVEALVLTLIWFCLREI